MEVSKTEEEKKGEERGTRSCNREKNYCPNFKTRMKTVPRFPKGTPKNARAFFVSGHTHYQLVWAL